MLAVECREKAEYHRHEFYETAGLEFPFVVTDMPAVVGEAFLFRVSLNDLDARTDHETAADLNIPQMTFSCSKCFIKKFRESAAESIIDPVAIFYGCRNGSLRSYDLALVIFHMNPHSI